MGNCADSDRKEKVRIGPVKPEPNKIKIRCVEVLGGETKGAYTIDNTTVEKSEDVFNILKRETRLSHYKLICKDLAAFYDESNNNDLIFVDESSKLHHNKVYGILVYKIQSKKFEFGKRTKPKNKIPLKLTSAGMITETDEEEEDNSPVGTSGTSTERQ